MWIVQVYVRLIMANPQPRANYSSVLFPNRTVPNHNLAR